MNKTTKILLTVAALATILIPSVADLNHTHATNASWPPHARFHWYVQWYGITSINALALYLLWGNYRDKGTRLSVVVAGLAPVTFWGTFLPSLLMPGTGTWPDGVEPPPGFPSIFTVIHPNLILALVITAACLLAIRLDGKARRQRVVIG